ncbi:MAG: DUF2971 domain-containing protein [Bacteroidales bacterium]|nr:DUF2971 domain-containing protein [Bacteroidales bacterium]
MDYDFDQDGRTIKGQLYKYYPLKEYHIEAFLNNKLFFAKPFTLNDSFDTSEKLIDPFPKFKELINWDKDKASLLDSHGICSFIESDSIKNSKMWAFYADNFNGFALEFDKKQLENDYNLLRPLPMMYLNKPVDLDNYNIVFHIQNTLFSIKDIPNDYDRLLDRIFQCIHLEKDKRIWANENEWRMIIGNVAISNKSFFNISEHPNGYFLSLKNNAYIRLYIGYRVPYKERCSLSEIAAIKGIDVFVVTPRIYNKQWDMEISSLLS